MRCDPFIVITLYWKAHSIYTDYEYLLYMGSVHESLNTLHDALVFYIDNRRLHISQSKGVLTAKTNYPSICIYDADVFLHQLYLTHLMYIHATAIHKSDILQSDSVSV